MEIITIYKILFYSTTIIWLWPPFRQWGTKYFIFFLILALSDPIALAYNLFTNQGFPLLGYVLLNYVMLLSIWSNSFFNKNRILLLAIIPFVILLEFLFNLQNVNLFTIAFLFFMMFSYVLHSFITKVVQTMEINLFTIILLFYLLTVVLKFTIILLGITDATAYFIITSIFQAIIGLYFSIFREDNSRFIFKLR